MMIHATEPPDRDFNEFVAELQRVCPSAVYDSGILTPVPRLSLRRRIELLRQLPDNAGVDALVAAWRRAAPDVEPEERRRFEELDELARLCNAELERIGLTPEDRAWIHAGWDHAPTRATYEKWLADLHRLPTGMGAPAYCAYLGFDYEQIRRQIGLIGPDAV